jgi:hypothetical protein
MSMPYAIQDRGRHEVDRRQSARHRCGSGDEGDDAQTLGFQNLAVERVSELGRKCSPRPALHDIANEGLHPRRNPVRSDQALL